jgi:ABC-type spermidine/putrescine transport system permease subunit II
MAEVKSLKVTSKTATTILVWLLFGIFVLGPLLTIVTISFVENIFHGDWTFSFASYRKLFTDPALYGPIFRSLEIAIVVMAIQLVFGSLIAYSTVRDRVYGAKTLDAMSNITIAVPSVVVGLALLAFYGGVGPVQSLTELVFGNPFTLTWTLWIVVFAHVLETFPYMVRSVTTGILKLNPQIESAALSLGARKFTVFRTITLPQLRSSLVAGSVLVFSRSIAEFGATIVVVSAVLRTAPLKIYVDAEAGSLELASAQSVVLMAMSMCAYILMTRGLLAKEMQSKAQI